MSTTPRTDAVCATLLARLAELKRQNASIENGVTLALEIFGNHAITLERENADLKAKLARAQAALLRAPTGWCPAHVELPWRAEHAQAIKEAEESRNG